MSTPSERDVLDALRSIQDPDFKRSIVDLGFVTRGPDPDDGRAQALTLTAEGEALLVAIRDSRDTWIRGLLSDWADDDVATFSAHLRHFASNLEASLADLTRRTDR